MMVSLRDLRPAQKVGSFVLLGACFGVNTPEHQPNIINFDTGSHTNSTNVFESTAVTSHTVLGHHFAYETEHQIDSA